MVATKNHTHFAPTPLISYGMTSLAFEKSLDSQPLDIYPLRHVFKLQQNFLNDFFTRRNYLFRLFRMFTLFSKSKNNI
jgi:hypothetical protein